MASRMLRKLNPGADFAPRRKDKSWDKLRPKGVSCAATYNHSEETINIGPLSIRFLVTGEDSQGSASVFEFRVPIGQKLAAPAHKNDAYEEIVYGIDGVLTWTVNGTPIEVGPGQALCIPRGAIHRFDNLGSKDVQQLVVISPAIMGPAYFREAAELIHAAAGAPPDREKMMDVFRRHGMTLAAPLPTPIS